MSKNGKILSFFFDGVPPPGSHNQGDTEANTAGGGTELQKKGESEKWFKIESRHPDYFKNLCNNCHDSTAGNFLKTKKKEQLCFTCHEAEKFTGQYIHGPTAVNQCLACHLPHESRYTKLLKEKAEELCFHCHNKDRLLPKVCAEAQACTQCHDPHAGNNGFFVKKKERAAQSGNQHAAVQ